MRLLFLKLCLILEHKVYARFIFIYHSFIYVYFVDILLVSGGELNSDRYFLVMLNGQIIGVHNQPKTLIAGMRLLRRRGKVRYHYLLLVLYNCFVF